MDGEFIFEENGFFIIKREIKGDLITFGSYSNLDDAIEAKEDLEDCGWPIPKDAFKNETKHMDEIGSEYGKYIYKEKNDFIVSRLINDEEIIFGRFKTLEEAKEFKYKLIDHAWATLFRDSQNKYGKFISKAYGKYFVSRTVCGEFKRFGSFYTLDDALKYRDELIKTNWGYPNNVDLYSRWDNYRDEKIEQYIFKEDIAYSLYSSKELFNNPELKTGKYIYSIYRPFNGYFYNFFGKFDSLNDAKFVKKLLIKNKWDRTIVPKSIFSDYSYFVPNNFTNTIEIFNYVDDTLISFGRFDSINSAQTAVNILKDNSWDLKSIPLDLYSDYSHIYFVTSPSNYDIRMYEITLSVGGEYISFGVFDTLDEAITERNRLISCNWGWDDVDFEEKFDENIYLKSDNLYYLKNEINGCMMVFGVFEDFLDAVNARLECIKSNWSFNCIPEDLYMDNKEYIPLLFPLEIPNYFKEEFEQYIKK